MILLIVLALVLVFSIFSRLNDMENNEIIFISNEVKTEYENMISKIKR